MENIRKGKGKKKTIPNKDPSALSSVVRKEPPLLWRLPGKGEQGGTLQKLKWFNTIFASKVYL